MENFPVILKREGVSMFQIERKHQLLLLIAALALLLFAGYKYAVFQADDGSKDTLIIEEKDSENDAATQEEDEREAKEIVIHVAGAVQNPGVYHLPSGARVIDAINLAGSTADSALDYLNLAAPLEDGKQIMVNSLKEMQNQQLPGNTTGVVPVNSGGGGVMPTDRIGENQNVSGRININTAGQAELEKLSGIGPSLSQRVMDHRNQNGPFLSVEDIMSVSGIGEKRFEQIKEHICVN